ncbi:Protein-glutamine gamma-glutamyltransferase [Thalassoglobus neptunius]|uniref:Protein-glutamine gamma-glutamyltransferase n=1 Tax=Thalassoglobus neptunius TaxID=1938619 RepID=A0A5C5X7P2_9PLAN|nr:transglutaminase family protein [Thalassoglobus neptunius]TWT58689.1 Protein-glutamine gamma-glutamyltransferase [Thalassoglobus neptunius]
MKYAITHSTTYAGKEPVSVCHNQSWLKPRLLAHQTCETFSLDISPPPSIRATRFDAFGNEVESFSFNQGYEVLKVNALSKIDVQPRSDSSEEDVPWESVRDAVCQGRSKESLENYLFTFESPRIRLSEEFQTYASASFEPGRGIVEAGADLTKRIFENFEFDDRATTVTTPVEEVFRIRRGVCQDFAHLQIAMLRSLKLPTRYVSGYLRTIPPPGKPRLVGADASHAWVSLYCGPSQGWVDYDPTNNLRPNLDHITVAWGRDYSDVPPLRGVFIGGGSHSLSVSVDVEPLG